MILGDTPRMDDPIRQRLARLQGADQRIVMLGVPCFYYERVIVQSLKVSAGPDGNYVLTGGLQPSNQDRAETGVVRKDKPFSGYLRRQSRLMDADGPRQETFPGWDVQPFGGIRVLVNRPLCPQGCIGSTKRLQPVLLSFKRISGQRQSAPPLTAVDVVPLDIGS